MTPAGTPVQLERCPRGNIPQLHGLFGPAVTFRGCSHGDASAYPPMADTRAAIHVSGSGWKGRPSTLPGISAQAVGGNISRCNGQGTLVLEFGHLHGLKLPHCARLLGSGPAFFSHGSVAGECGSLYVPGDDLKPTAGTKGKTSWSSAFHPFPSYAIVAERLGITNALVLNLAPRILAGVAGYTAPKGYEPLGEALRIAASCRR